MEPVPKGARSSITYANRSPHRASHPLLLILGGDVSEIISPLGHPEHLVRLLALVRVDRVRAREVVPVRCDHLVVAAADDRESDLVLGEEGRREFGREERKVVLTCRVIFTSDRPLAFCKGMPSQKQSKP